MIEHHQQTLARIDEEMIARSLRRGILQSMRQIRVQLMTRGEWEDPSILPLTDLDLKIHDVGYRTYDELVKKAQHEHSMRWTVKQVRKQQDARGAEWN